MLIDWFTVGAQALNFVILVWLMKRFLFRPIVDVVAARDQRVAAELAGAKQKQLAAWQERDSFRQKNEGFDRDRDALVQKVKDAADHQGKQLLAAARQAAEVTRDKLQQAMLEEAAILKDAVANRAKREVFAIARKALADLATVSLEARVVEVFLRRLRELDDDAKAKLQQSVSATSEPALVRTAFELPADLRDEIQQGCNATFSMRVPIRFETAPDLVSGIEFRASGLKVAWSIDEYLHSLLEGVNELLSQQRAAGTPPPANNEAAHDHAR